MQFGSRLTLSTCIKMCYCHSGSACKASTVEPRLSGLFDYPDFFSGADFFMNINKL